MFRWFIRPLVSYLLSTASCLSGAGASQLSDCYIPLMLWGGTNRRPVAQGSVVSYARSYSNSFLLLPSHDFVIVYYNI